MGWSVTNIKKRNRNWDSNNTKWLQFTENLDYSTLAFKHFKPISPDISHHSQKILKVQYWSPLQQKFPKFHQVKALLSGWLNQLQYITLRQVSLQMFEPRFEIQFIDHFVFVSIKQFK